MLRLLVCAALLLSIACAGQPTPSYTKTRDGVIVYPSVSYPGNARSITIQVLTGSIFRVIASPQKEPAPVKSLITTYDSTNMDQWELVATDQQNITVKTNFVSARVDLQTGNINFYDRNGKLILTEKKMSRHIEPVVHEGGQSYAITQTFDTSADDAWYGLGQHQDGLMNYKGYQVSLFQNNTEVAVPFLVSKKNYGILWDNYSLTKIGDIREYKPLSALKLFAKDGQQGWLTASYANDRNKPAEVILEKAESDINYEYLNDSKLKLPTEFKPLNGVITWEGSLGSDVTGEHKLRFTYAGYFKVWLNGQLVLDRWRQAWNPCVAIVPLNIEKGRRYPIKIEWMPDGKESYVSCKSMEPLIPGTENDCGFYSEAGQQMDYYFIYGNKMDEVIAGYRHITGKATMVPKWAMGLWQSRERYKTQEEILAAVQEFRKRKIPLDNIVLDWSYWKVDAWGSQEFEASRFPNPDSMISVLHKKYNTRFMISVWPKFYEGIEAYKHFDKNGWLYKRNIADRQRDWIGQGYISTFYDAFNKDARQGFWNLIHDKIYKKGIDAWWMDASEPDILSNVNPQKRKEQMYPLAAGITSEYINAYPLENARGIYEGQRGVNPNQRVFLLTRSAFAGLQRYASAVWSGDIAARWHDMKLQIPAGVNLSMSGIPYWSMDIGGFAVEQKFEKPNAQDLEEWREQMTRWYQFGAFVPLFRVHGQFPFREIYNVAPAEHPAYQSMLYYDKLRYRLMPYIYSLAGHVYHRGSTIMRGLVMDFSDDEAVTNINDQYMFGPWLLINPVYTYKQRNKQVYLPKGSGWYDFYSGKYTDGGKTINAEAPYERMPIFVREGAIIPFGPDIQYTDEKKADTIVLYVYGGKESGFTLYEDEGTNYNYEKDMYSTITFHYSEAQKNLTIYERNGSFPGMMKDRIFRVIYISKDKPVGLNPDNKNGILVNYSGTRRVVSFK